MVALTSKKQSKRTRAPSREEKPWFQPRDWTSGLEKMVLWFYSDYTAASSQTHVDVDRRLLHSFQRLICQMCIWCGEPSPAGCTAMIAGTTSCESVLTVNIWLWESIWGGWVLIFYHSLNNMFAWKIFYHTRVRWLVFEVLFLPTVDVIYWVYNLKKTYYCVFCNLNVLSFLTYLCSFFCLHVCTFTCSQIKL